jgi:Mg-chelatase subunit ChlI
MDLEARQERGNDSLHGPVFCNITNEVSSTSALNYIDRKVEAVNTKRGDSELLEGKESFRAEDMRSTARIALRRRRANYSTRSAACRRAKALSRVFFVSVYPEGM